MDYFLEQQADVFCIQEAKAHPDQVSDFLLPAEYHSFWNPAEKKGYSGVAVFTKHQPQKVSYGIGHDHHDREGRVLTLEFDTFFLVNVYTPNSKRGLERLDYRQNAWDKDFLLYLLQLEEQKPVIFCGDLNVAHKEIDLANPRTNRRNAGFTDEEREGFTNIVNAGFVDTFREIEPGPHHYTWWSYMNNARARNIGWRIDYWCLSSRLRPQLKDAWIHPHVMGSDHCPVGMELG